MRKRLEDFWGPNSQKDAEEMRRLLNDLHGDDRGWDVFLAALDDIVDVLSKTPVRDVANNPILETIPTRPHNPLPPAASTQAEFQAYVAQEQLDETNWNALHPPGKTLNHRPTDNAIKEIVTLALGSSSHNAYSSLAQRYQQVDHAAKTWIDLRQDLQTLVRERSLWRCS